MRSCSCRYRLAEPWAPPLAPNWASQSLLPMSPVKGNSGAVSCSPPFHGFASVYEDNATPFARAVERASDPPYLANLIKNSLCRRYSSLPRSARWVCEMWCSRFSHNRETPRNNGETGRVFCANSALPEVHARPRREVILLSRLHAHRVVPRIQIAHRSDNAEFRGAVRIGQYPLSRGLFPRFVAPALCIAQEQPLIAGKTVQHRWLLALERQMIGGLSNDESGEVCDVLAQG